MQYNPNSVVLSVVSTAALVGDYNQNGVVDAADYAVWRDTLGTVGGGLAADGDNSGEVDAADYVLWRANFGQTAAGSATGLTSGALVPEPASVMLLLTACAAIGSLSLRERAKVRLT